MSWWHARWLGAVIGLIGGTIIGLVIVAWRTSVPLGLIATVAAIPISVWIIRHFPVHVLGRRTSPLLDRPVLPGEYAIRFVCGFVVGAILGFFGAARYCDTVPPLIIVTITLATLCGVLSMVLGDRFWTRYYRSSELEGIQIGVFNGCRDGYGIQIGLWSANEQRSLPIINWIWRWREEGEVATEGTEFTKGMVRGDGTVPIPRKGGRIGVPREHPSPL